MKIAICSSYVPFILGGARNIVEWLEQMLIIAGHQVEVIYLPQIDSPDFLFTQMAAYRWIDLIDSADRIICFRPPAHIIAHPHKIIWFIHHIRIFYDLWDTPYRGFEDDLKHCYIREALIRADNTALHEAKKVFTNSQIVSARLEKFNQIKSEVLYPPIYKPENYYCHDFNDEIVCVARIEPVKRQHLLIEALKFTKTPVKLRLCGTSSHSAYPDQLEVIINKIGCWHRIKFDNHWISDQEKITIFSQCLAAAYLPLDEDSYGYPSLEASHSSKPVLTTTDSGGVLELIQDGENGFITEPDPQALAAAMDRLYIEKNLTRQMGKNALCKIKELNISWENVLDKMLS